MLCIEKNAGTYGKVVPISSKQCRKYTKLFHAGEFEPSGLREYMFYKRYYFKHMGVVEGVINKNCVEIKMQLGTKNLYYTDIIAQDVPKVLWQITAHLYWMHKFGIGHYDLKSSNIVLINDKWCLIDYGTSYINPRGVLTTFAYAPPESFSDGYKPKPIHDVWALGCILYELITGDLLLHKYEICNFQKIKIIAAKEIWDVVKSAINETDDPRYKTLLSMTLASIDQRCTAFDVLDYINRNWPDSIGNLADYELIYRMPSYWFARPNNRINTFLADQWNDCEDNNTKCSETIEYIDSLD